MGIGSAAEGVRPLVVGRRLCELKGERGFIRSVREDSPAPGTEFDTPGEAYR